MSEAIDRTDRLVLDKDRAYNPSELLDFVAALAERVAALEEVTKGLRNLKLLYDCDHG